MVHVMNMRYNLDNVIKIFKGVNVNKTADRF